MDTATLLLLGAFALWVVNRLNALRDVQYEIAAALRRMEEHWHIVEGRAVDAGHGGSPPAAA